MHEITMVLYFCGAQQEALTTATVQCYLKCADMEGVYCSQWFSRENIIKPHKKTCRVFLACLKVLYHRNQYFPQMFELEEFNVVYKHSFKTVP